MKQGMLKIHFILGAIALFLVLLMGRVYYWQCTDQKTYNELNQNQLRSTVKVDAHRHKGIAYIVARVTYKSYS